MSGRNSHLVSRTFVFAGVVIGLALLWSRRRARVERGEPGSVEPQAVEPTIAANSAVPQIYRLPGDKAVLYLRGFMDGHEEAE